MARRKRHRPPSEGVDLETPVNGLRAIAIFEGLKGLTALLLAGALLTLLHRDVEHVAEQLLVHLHVGMEHHASRAFLRLAHGMNDRRIWAVAGGAVAYTVVRSTEAYGLWHRRVWAEWFALLSGTLYLPWEIYSVSMHPNILMSSSRRTLRSFCTCFTFACAPAVRFSTAKTTAALDRVRSQRRRDCLDRI